MIKNKINITPTNPNITDEIIIPALDNDCDFKLPVRFASLLAIMLTINPTIKVKNTSTNPTMLNDEYVSA